MQDKTKSLVGRVVLAPKGNCTIEEIKTPIAKEILVLGASDFKTGFVSIGADSYPILAQDTVQYDNQPVLAVFGPTYEEVEMYCKGIEISYSENPPVQTTEVGSFSKSYGEKPSYNDEDVSKFTSHVEVVAHSNSTVRGQRIRVLYDEGKIYAKVSSQWPMNLKASLANELDVDIRDITLYADDYYSPYDQLLIQPTLTTLVAAVASKKTGCTIEYSIPMTSFQPAISIDFETVLGEENKILDHTVTAHVDLGAFPIFPQEYCVQMFAGLVPSYPLKHLSVSCSATTSSNHPAGFFNDLGHAVALAASENHFNSIAHEKNIIPSVFKAKLFGPEDNSNNGLFSEIHDLVRDFTCSYSVSSTLNDCAQTSNFNRFYSVNNQVANTVRGVNPFINYSRGIGIACGEGIQDFSNNFQQSKCYSMTTTLTESRRLVVSTGLEGSKSMKKIWTDIIEDRLNIDKQNIIFIGINDEDSIDIGPSVLSRTVRLVPMLIESSCDEINRRLEKGELPPITTTVSNSRHNGTHLFNSDTCGSIAVSLHIDTQSLCPVIDKIWARINFGKIFDVSKLKSSLKRQITMTILEICPCVKNTFDIDLLIHSDSSKPTGSASSLVRGLIISAFIDALSQATSHRIYRIPVSEHDMLGIIRKGTQKASVSKEVSDEV